MLLALLEITGATLQRKQKDTRLVLGPEVEAGLASPFDIVGLDEGPQVPAHKAYVLVPYSMLVLISEVRRRYYSSGFTTKPRKRRPRLRTNRTLLFLENKPVGHSTGDTVLFFDG